mmetsp:Transcript_33800/g.84821  ORF Transcript_33800/g.84821 Transcript_33800/m.84821 type:complete len:607 (-) Transcript_33800:429-2249(-)
MADAQASRKMSNAINKIVSHKEKESPNMAFTKFDGQVYDGKKHGHGTMTFCDGSVYEGEWADGRREGFGVLELANGETVYEGLWKDDQPYKGMLSSPVGKFVGEVVVKETKRGIQIAKEGQGEMWYTTGDMYTGCWCGDQRAGFGIQRMASGEFYHGTWQKDQRHGHGVLTFVDGTVFDGNWVYGRRDGQGTMLMCTGDKLTGMWKGDQILNGTFSKGTMSSLSPMQTALLKTAIQEKKELDKMAVAVPETSFDRWNGMMCNFVYSQHLDLKMTGKDAALNYLKKRLESHLHPLGRLVYHFVRYFDGLYGERMVNQKKNITLLPGAIQDLQNFQEKMLATVVGCFPDLHRDEFMEDVSYRAVELAYFPRIYRVLFTLRKLHDRQRNIVMSEKLRELRKVELADLGIAAGGTHEDLEGAITCLQKIAGSHVPTEKLELLMATFDQIFAFIEKKKQGSGSEGPDMWGADTVFPIFQYVMIKADIADIHSEYKMMADFTSAYLSRNTSIDYRVATFKAGLRQLIKLDWKIRDASGTLVPMTTLQRMLRDAVADTGLIARRADGQPTRLSSCVGSGVGGGAGAARHAGGSHGGACRGGRPGRGAAGAQPV